MSVSKLFDLFSCFYINYAREAIFAGTAIGITIGTYDGIKRGDALRVIDGVYIGFLGGFAGGVFWPLAIGPASVYLYHRYRHARSKHS